MAAPADPRDFIVQLLKEKGPVPEQNIGALNFLETGLIDSFALIKFIFRIEDAYSIVFSPEEMACREIHTVDGLAHLITTKRSAPAPGEEHTA